MSEISKLPEIAPVEVGVKDTTTVQLWRNPRVAGQVEDGATWNGAGAVTALTTSAAAGLKLVRVKVWRLDELPTFTAPNESDEGPSSTVPCRAVVPDVHPADTVTVKVGVTALGLTPLAAVMVNV